MKWFKHLSDASKAGELIAEIEDIFGLEGYARYFKLLEAVAYKMDTSDKCSAAYPWSKWQTFLKGKRKKLETFLVYLENKQEINLKQNGNILEIEIPKLAQLRDNHTKNLQVTSKQLAPRIRIKNKNKELDICNPPINPPREKIKPRFDDDDFQLAEEMSEKIAVVIPNVKPPKLNDWANCIRLIREQDNKTIADIRALFDWANRNEFWQTNICSPQKLRKQWDTLQGQRARGQPKQQYGPVAPIRKFTETREVPL